MFALVLFAMSGNGLAWQTVDQTASTTSPENSAFDAEVVSKLEERLAELEAKFADSKKEAEDSSKEKSGDKKGTAQESTAKWNVRLGGHVQLDFVHWADSSPSIDAFVWWPTAQATTYSTFVCR
jgi:hypothetical protein